MAFVKVKVDALEQQKKEYEKAIKSLGGALEQIKKVNASLGTDAMLEGVRTSLTKLAASLETNIYYRSVHSIRDFSMTAHHLYFKFRTSCLNLLHYPP